MNNLPLIKPQETTVKSMDGEDKEFRISRVPAIKGRELFTQYIPTATPKIGDYKSNEKLMKELVSFIEVKTPSGEWLRLSNDAVLASHVTDWEMLVKLEMEMIKYNTNFFNPEKLSSALSKFNQTLPEKIIKTLKRFSGQLSAKDKQA